MSIQIHLRKIRTLRAISAAELARQVGLSRQAIHAIESGAFVPNTTVSLQLARILNVGVEELFSLGEPATEEHLEASLLASTPSIAEGQLIQACRVNGRIVAFPVPLMPTYIPNADGVIARKQKSTVAMESLATLPQDGQRLLLAGCDPALSLLNQRLLSKGLEIISASCTSRRALQWLKSGSVHAAGSHLLDRASGDYNIPIIRRLFPKQSVRVVTFATWEQGLVVKRGNPKSIRSLGDLGESGICIMNREKGSGSRDLLDAGLRKNGISVQRLRGYSSAAPGHLAAAYAVATDSVDCCIASRSAARCFGLDFIPLAVERFDLVFHYQSLALPATRALLDELNGSTFRHRLRSFAGYETSQTGQVLM